MYGVVVGFRTAYASYGAWPSGKSKIDNAI